MLDLNRNLIDAKINKKDEFYTQLLDIEAELQHYKAHFKDKVIYCNCDDWEKSNFTKYFKDNFKQLGLKKLISSCYIQDSQGKLFEYDGKDMRTRLLNSDGDFRSKECTQLLNQADIVVTNPPFSQFREYIAQLIEYKKKFLIIGNVNAITYKDIFPLIKENKLFIGQSMSSGDREFGVPKDYPLISSGNRVDSEGNKFIRVKGVRWFTNLSYTKRSENLILDKTYKGNESYYPKYENYNAINVDKTKEIPNDYKGLMGVPITFMDKHNPEQFEIVGLGQGNLYKELADKGLSEKFVNDYYKEGGTGSIKKNHPVLGYYDNNGKAKIPYMRIIIRRI